MPRHRPRAARAAKKKKNSVPRVVKGQGSTALTKEEFRARFLQRFYDPAFRATAKDLDRVLAVAWDAYEEYRKSPRTRKAGPGFADPDFDLPTEWLETRDKIAKAQREHDRAAGPSRILLVCGSARSDQTCPGEMSKTFRLVTLAKSVLDAAGVETDLLDLSRLTSEYGRVIYPCKACVSTAMPLCHWPCSCYPNHAIGQTQDWMNDIYPRWVAAHGVMIVTPVNWYQAPSVLKLMIDRLVCADGGNPDPTSTQGKDPARAKAIELAGWDYPKHLAGRAFSVVVHGDVEGVDEVRRALHDWLAWMKLVPAGPAAHVARYLGYYRPYATSHDDLDADTPLQEEVRNAAESLLDAVGRLRRGECPPSPADARDPRPK